MSALSYYVIPPGAFTKKTLSRLIYESSCVLNCAGASPFGLLAI